MDIKQLLNQIEINGDQITWLNECYTHLKTHGNILPYKQVKLNTMKQVSKGFEAWKIDEKLLKNKVEITVLGVIAIERHEEMFNISDKVFRFIRNELIEDADKEKFDLDLIADCINEERKLVRIFYKMFSEYNLGLWRSAGSNNNDQWGYERFTIDDNCFDIFMNNASMTEVFMERQKKVFQHQNSFNNKIDHSNRGNSNKLDTTKVFIVHGHDDLLKTEVARFIEKLNLTAIILHEQASSGQTIIEKIEANSNVGFGVVLYTPCDFGGKEEPNKVEKPRARQNVVFEHGYLIGKIGRENVCALVKGNIEKPNDISGVVYITKDNGEGWKLQLAKEMKKSGYEIDLNSIL